MSNNRKPYWTCNDCGANLDFGEKCDCHEHPATKKAARYFMDIQNNDFVVILETGEEIKVTPEDYIAAAEGSVVENMTPMDVIDYAIYRNQTQVKLGEVG